MGATKQAEGEDHRTAMVGRALGQRQKPKKPGDFHDMVRPPSHPRAFGVGDGVWGAGDHGRRTGVWDSTSIGCLSRAGRGVVRACRRFRRLDVGWSEPGRGSDCPVGGVGGLGTGGQRRIADRCILDRVEQHAGLAGYLPEWLCGRGYWRRSDVGRGGCICANVAADWDRGEHRRRGGGDGTAAAVHQSLRQWGRLARAVANGSGGVAWERDGSA